MRRRGRPGVEAAISRSFDRADQRHREPKQTTDDDARLAAADGLEQTALLLALAAAGAGFGALVLFCDRIFGWGASAKSFVDQPSTTFWIAFICGQTALWAVLIVPVARALKELEQQHHKRGAILAGSALTVIVIGFVFVSSLVSEADYPLPHHTWKITLLTAIGYAVTLLAAIGIWRIHTIAGAVLSENSDPNAEQLATLLRLRQLLNQMLGVQGVVIGAAILASSSLRNAIIDWNKYVAAASDPKLQAGRELPYEYVLVYGAFFSAVLALIYAPTHSRLQVIGRRLRDRAATLPAPTARSFSTKLQRWKDLDELLELKLSGIASFGASVSILTPLATSVVGLLLNSP